MRSSPIGIFDSGIGGLTVAKAINQLMPAENLIYFGDTYHSPWGDKSKVVIEHYVTTICDFLLAQHCKAIIVACNTASAVASSYITKYVANRAHVVNVIDPTVEYIGKNMAGQRIGLIGTKQTIASASYTSRIAEVAADIEVRSLATHLLVSLIEEGFIDKPACALILEEYLSNPILDNISALILGCTHYPLLKTQISAFYKTTENKKEVTLIDNAALTADYLQRLLIDNNLANANNTAQNQFFISDYNPHFVSIAQHFFTDYTLTPYQMWDV